MTDAVRLFVITWDPLAGMVERPSGFATTNGGSADLEIVVYLPTWSLVDMATARNNTLAAVMGAMAGSAVVTASHHEDPRMPAATQIWPPGARCRISSPTQRQAARSARRTCISTLR